MTLRFGKWKGVPLTEIPESYLTWLLGQDWLWISVRAQIEDELDTRLRARQWEQRQRQQQRSHRAFLGEKTVDPALAATVVKRGFKALTLEQHPDVGGSHEGMIRLTATKNWLLGTIQQALPRGPEEEEWR
jgi:hypothetical protein